MSTHLNVNISIAEAFKTSFEYLENVYYQTGSIHKENRAKEHCIGKIARACIGNVGYLAALVAGGASICALTGVSVVIGITAPWTLFFVALGLAVIAGGIQTKFYAREIRLFVDDKSLENLKSHLHLFVANTYPFTENFNKNLNERLKFIPQKNFEEEAEIIAKSQNTLQCIARISDSLKYLKDHTPRYRPFFATEACKLLENSTLSAELQEKIRRLTKAIIEQSEAVAKAKEKIEKNDLIVECDPSKSDNTSKLKENTFFSNIKLIDHLCDAVEIR